MKTERNEKFIRWCILGAIGGILMAAGDWLLGCIPIQATDTGMFDRAYYLSGTYGLWRPVLIVGMGAIGAFFYYFMVGALNMNIDARYRKTKLVQHLCGIFTVAVALADPSLVGDIGMVYHISGPADRIGGGAHSGYGLSGRYAHRNFAGVSPDAIDDRDPFRDATCWKNPISPVDARFSSGHMEPSARSYSGYCTGHADTCCHMDVRYEPEQHKQRDRDLVHSGCNS